MLTGEGEQPWEKRTSVRSQNRVRIGDAFKKPEVSGLFMDQLGDQLSQEEKWQWMCTGNTDAEKRKNV